MSDPRKPIHDLLRPHLKQGWNTPGLLAEFAKALDALGVPREPVAVTPKPATAVGSLSKWQQQIDLDLLDLAFPANTPAGLAPWVVPTQTACVRWGIDTAREIASFLANINVETAGLTRLEESLNYSVEALIEKFGRHRISIADAKAYGRTATRPANQEKLANLLYGGTFGKENLGNIHPGDGWKFKGYGPKQLTGRYNQSEFAKAVGMNVDDVPAFVRTPEGGMMSAGWFWKSRNMDALAATPGVADDRKAINGGSFGLADVERIFDLLIDEMIRRDRAG